MLEYHFSINTQWRRECANHGIFDAELKALDDKARGLKTRKVQQLGELVIATGADISTADELAGALIVPTGDQRCWKEGGVGQARSRVLSEPGATNCTGS